MANKYQLVNEMANETIKYISQSSENWIEFLNTASNNYKYSFSEQVLIYAQKANATACADIETWNKRLKRWVNKGAKGIALLSIENGRSVLRHVFDISDTHSGIGQDLKLWEVKPSYTNGIIETLENSFGNLEIKDTLAEAIYSSSINLVEDNFQDYLVDLKEVTEGSFLQELNDIELESYFRGILANSIAYMTMKRCGIDPMEHFSLADFEIIKQFNNKRVISRLGAATSDIAEREIREIYSSVINFEKNNKLTNRTFVNNEKMNYHNNEEKNSEGRNDYDRINIQTNGRLSDTTSSITKNKENNTGEIFKNEGELPKRIQKRVIRGIDDRWQNGRTFRRNRTDSSKENETNNNKFSRKEPNNRENEKRESNGVGTSNELNKKPSRGNDNSRVNLQLNLFEDTYVPPIKELPSVEKQIDNIKTQAEVENTPAFSFTQEMIDKTLQSGTGHQNGKFRVYRLYQETLSSKERQDFLKKEFNYYGTNGVAGLDGIWVEYTPSKGLKLSKREIEDTMQVNWNTIEKRIGELISLDRYFANDEKEKYQNWLENDYENEKWMFNQVFKDENVNENDKIEIQNIDKNYKLKNGNYFHFHTNEEGYYYAIYDNRGTEIDGGLLEYSQNTDKENLDDIRKDLAEFTGITELIDKNLEEVSQEFIDNLEFDIIPREIEQAQNVLNLFKKREENGEPLNRDEYYKNQEKHNYHINDNLLGEGTPKEKKSNDRNNVKAYTTYGTSRINAYKIIEQTLNLKDVKIFDTFIDDEGRKQRVLNRKETAIACSKQDAIKEAFLNWVWEDPERRNHLVRLYNDKFNCIRPREYDGSHIDFVGMNPEIKLRTHQLNAVAHVLYGNNTLLAHEVGAGKTFEMVASAMESKRLGLCNKSLFVVPNHIIEQFASEFLQLYPSANILVATKKDFETKNRKKFCSRIATGEFDAVIIGHSQFERIPMSIERQIALLEEQISDITKGIASEKNNRGENYTIKQMEKTRKSLETRLEKLHKEERKDDVVTFEELGVDKLFVDEAHNYKNLFLYTKMRNVGGIAQTEAQKSSDLFMKCRYLDEITGGKGSVFATGTPVSNSMAELYTMQRYLQYTGLKENSLEHFDNWASTFGETVTAIELAPEGTGYRAKTRFAKFHNLPELMSMFKEVADIQTAETLNLPTPEFENINVVVKPSEIQQEMVKALGERAEKIRAGTVDATEDNMLKITNEGRKLALDQRLMNPLLPDSESSKVNSCAENVYRIWDENSDKKSTQLVFCDLSTPKDLKGYEKEEFTDVYNELKKKLIQKGIPPDEIAFIHEADNEVKKKELFSKVRKGQVRVLMGSTQKMGAGTNVQDKLIATHHLDCAWKPSDLTQRNGRMIRQGNENKKVFVYSYVTEKTFDSYMYQLVEQKQKFISQIMTSKTPARTMEDIDDKALTYGEIKALATGNPKILEKTSLDTDVAKLRLLKQEFMNQKYSLQDKIIKYFPEEIARLNNKIGAMEEDIIKLQEYTRPNADGFSPMKINGITYTEKQEAGKKLLESIQDLKSMETREIGEYRGFTMEMSFDSITRNIRLKLKNKFSYSIDLGTDVNGNITRINNCLENIAKDIPHERDLLDNTYFQLENAKQESQKEFPKEQELQEKLRKLEEINAELKINENEHEMLGDEKEEKQDKSPDKNSPERC